jgi:uncharacterized repeat protein (TIGR01451 family)
MKLFKAQTIAKGFRSALPLSAGLLLVTVLLIFARGSSLQANAAPINPPEGYPKLSLSTKTVTPTLAEPGGARLLYAVEIRNTGAYKAENTQFSDRIPANTIYANDAESSAGGNFSFSNGVLTWSGTVGFDSSVVISFNVDVNTDFVGVITNTAVISQALIKEPVSVTAQTVVTDKPILTIAKTSTPVKPGPNKPLTYLIEVTNQGQPATSIPITVKDKIPLHTTFLKTGPDGSYNSSTKLVTWNRTIDLDTGATSVFTFSVIVDDVDSGTVVSNMDYQVSSPGIDTSTGNVYTTTVVDPIFSISKSTFPDPPGSNREMTYTLTVLNKGSLATDLQVEDKLPAGVEYLRGGTFSNGTVSWNLPSLDTGKSARFWFTVYVDDIAEVDVLNQDYSVCSAEGVCQNGKVLTSTIEGPLFEVTALLDPIAKKPGGKNDTSAGPVTPTLTIKNLGPGNALDATATIYFTRISISLNDMVAIPPQYDTFTKGSSCGENCVSYLWSGDIDVGQTITFTTDGGQSTIGGEEGTIYTATLVVSDTLGPVATAPISATATGKVTHFANLIPVKSAPPAVGAGQLMTYTIQVLNSGLSTDSPPSPILTETVPLSVTLVNVDDGGIYNQVGDRTVISWTLPDLSPGEAVARRFSVEVDPDLISGTLLVNDDYRTSWFDVEAGGILSNTGQPITTVVKEVGLIDSFKTVTPTVVHPGPGNLLTYTVNVVNSGPSPLEGVQVHDLFPWEDSTYQLNATASAGELISDIISLDWVGDLAPYSSEQITFTVLVDDEFQGPITNTAYISHDSLKNILPVHAVAYVTDKPVLRISKTASPDPVMEGASLLYTLQVENLGQQATELLITDTIPTDTTYLSGGSLVGNQVHWELPVLEPVEKQTFTFKVKVEDGEEIVNDRYGVTCAEGVSASGMPVITTVTHPRPKGVYLPMILKN